MFTGAYYGGELVYTHGVAVKAVPVPESEAGHHEEEGSHSHEPGPGQQKTSGDSAQAKTKPDSGKLAHKHRDGTVHEH